MYLYINIYVRICIDICIYKNTAVTILAACALKPPISDMRTSMYLSIYTQICLHMFKYIFVHTCTFMYRYMYI
jgi:hypothetical protein